MKTIRHNTFETNSSSTHAYTLNVPKKADFKPLFEEGIKSIDIQRYSTGVTSWQSRLGLLSHYLVLTDRQKFLKNLIETVEHFIDKSINFIDRSYSVVYPIQSQLAEGDDYAETLLEYLKDEFYSMTNEYGHGSAKAFKDTLEEITSTIGLSLAFIFSNSAYETETWYNS